MDILGRVYGATQATITTSPQGQVYLSVGTTLFRLDDTGPPRLDTLAELGVVPTALRAPADDEIFFLAQASPEIYRWRHGHGVESMRNPVRDSVFADGHFMDHLNLMDLWGGRGREMYAVGDFATILRYDGERWSLEANPLLAAARSDTREVYRSYLWSVAGDTGAVYAVGINDVLSRRQGRWAADVPPGTDSVAWWLAMGTPRNTYLVGRREQTREYLLFHRSAGGGWKRMDQALAALRHEPVRGTGQPDGSALFWTAGGEVVRVVGTRVTVYRRLGLRSVVGAAVSRNHLYVVGGSGASSVILRLNLET